ncbi:MAG: hypothetical protein JNK12_09075 [Acidimicrobiales bacterium]|nr:hypothetical protein [Acidimicrobiales bacterium]
MTPDRRPVRIAASFFDDLDAQFPPERGRNGAPSAHDFLVYELVRIVDQVASEWDTLAELIAGRGEYRILTAVGILVPVFTVVGQLAADGAIELIQLEVDRSTDWD